MEILHALRRPAGNDRGMALILSIFLLLFIALFGMIGITIANHETDGAGSQRREQQYLDQAQGGLDVALQKGDWLNTALLLGSTDAINTVSETDPNGTVLAHITAWDVHTGSYLGDQEPMPKQDFKTDPPAGSGYSAGKFKIYHFAVTATASSPDGKSYEIREGVWRAFNNY